MKLGRGSEPLRKFGIFGETIFSTHCMRPVDHLKSIYSSRQLFRAESYVLREAINRKQVFPAAYRERYLLTWALYLTVYVCNVVNLKRFVIIFNRPGVAGAVLQTAS